MAKEKKKEEEHNHDHAHEQGMGKIDVETARKIQELQIFDQNLQNLTMQKQNMQFELNEVLSALGEIQNTKEEIYKITGSIMIKSKKEDVEKDLKEKEEMLNLKIKNIDKQENILKEKLLKVREEVMLELK